MASYNRVVLVGNATRDTEMRYSGAGVGVASVGIAVNEKRKQGEEWVDEATFVDLTFFGKQAETASQYIVKGTQFLVEGKLRLEKWETREGEKRSKLTVIGDRLVLLGRREERPDENQPQAGPTNDGPTDDVPF